MKTISQYNKIIHDWLVLLTDLNGKYVRPQRNQYGFSLTDESGNPIAFESTVCMFYVGFEDKPVDKNYIDVDTVENLKNLSISITFIGESSDIYASQLQALALSNTSRQYLYENDLSIYGSPTAIIDDKNYDKKWFYRRSLLLKMNTVVTFTPTSAPIENDTKEVAGSINNKTFNSKI